MIPDYLKKMNDQWMIIDGAGQQVGPYDTATLYGYFQQGIVNGETLAWQAGMESWVPLSYLSIFPSASATPLNPYAVPQSHPQAFHPSTPSILGYTPIKSVNFSTWVIFLIMGYALAGVASFLAARASAAEGQIDGSSFGSVVLALMGIGLFFLIFTGICQFIFLYKAWKGISGFPSTRTSPGKAVGFLFIPFFNIYWIFIAYVGLATDYGKATEALGDRFAPRISKSLVLTSLILNFIPGAAVINVVLGPLVNSQICKAINHMSQAAAIRPRL